MPVPSKFAHVVYQTHRYDEMIAWYQKVFDAKVQARTDKLAFLTYDEEHHRMAFLNLGPVAGEAPKKPAQSPGVHHVAYTWDTLDGLLDTYRKLKAMNVLPFFKVRHGPTLSMYYADPDGNGMEFQIDLLDVDSANEFMHSDAFAKNPIGEPFDPDALLAQFEAGADVRVMLLRSDQTLPAAGFATSVGQQA